MRRSGAACVLELRAAASASAPCASPASTRARRSASAIPACAHRHRRAPPALPAWLRAAAAGSSARNAAKPCMRKAAGDAGKARASRSATWRAPSALSDSSSAFSTVASPASGPPSAPREPGPVMRRGSVDPVQRQGCAGRREARVGGRRFEPDPALGQPQGDRGLQGQGGNLHGARQRDGSRRARPHIAGPRAGTADESARSPP